MIFIY